MYALPSSSGQTPTLASLLMSLRPHFGHIFPHNRWRPVDRRCGGGRGRRGRNVRRLFQETCSRSYWSWSHTLSIACSTGSQRSTNGALPYTAASILLLVFPLIMKLSDTVSQSAGVIRNETSTPAMGPF